MGGPGSGDTGPRGGRPTVEDFLFLDVRKLHRDGMLRPTEWPLTLRWWSVRGDDRWSMGSAGLRVETDAVELSYRVVGESPGEVIRCRVLLIRTPCGFGGARPWFRCPVIDCGRRCAVVYVTDARVACRRCLGLAYPSQRENLFYRLLRKRDKIRERLGTDSDGEPLGKPARMHRTTFEQLSDAADQADFGALRAIAGRLRLGGL